MCMRTPLRTRGLSQPPLIEQELADMMEHLDGDGDGQIDFEEFYRWWRGDGDEWSTAGYFSPGSGARRVGRAARTATLAATRLRAQQGLASSAPVNRM